MKLISWNVNGFRAVVRKEAFDWISIEDPDILCLQEVKAELDQAQPFPTILERYEHVFWNACQRKKGYSGTAIFSKIKPKAVSYEIGIKEFDEEGRVVQAEFDDFVIMNIYFPNSGMEGRLDFKMKFNEALTKHSNEILSKGKALIVTGDYNVAHKEIDIARPKENEEKAGFTKVEREWMDRYTTIPMHDSFRMFHTEPERYSWWNMRFGARPKNIGWRIDYFCVSDTLKDKVKNADILDSIQGSDHAPVLLELK
jgi:exodeoxyribonuclease-3